MADYYFAIDQGQEHFQATVSDSATPTKAVELRVNTSLDPMAIELALENLMRRILEGPWPPL